MIDAHVHYGKFVYGNKNWSDIGEYTKIAKKIGIKYFCTVPIGLRENFEKKTTPDNNSVLELKKKNDNVIPVYWINIFDKNINKNYIESNYAAIKFHPDIGEVSIDNKKLISIIKDIELPLFVHTNESKEYSSLEKLISLAKKIPEKDFIAIHSGSVTRTFFKLFNYKIPKNIYFEVSGLQYEIILKKIYSIVGAKKIIFGSDYPFGDPRVALERIKVVAKNKKEFSLMTGDNIKGVLKC